MEQILFNKIWKEFQQSILSRGSEVVAPLFLIGVDARLFRPFKTTRKVSSSPVQLGFHRLVVDEMPHHFCVQWLVEHLSLQSCSDWVQIPFRSP